MSRSNFFCFIFLFLTSAIAFSTEIPTIVELGPETFVHEVEVLPPIQDEQGIQRTPVRLRAYDQAQRRPVEKTYYVLTSESANKAEYQLSEVPRLVPYITQELNKRKLYVPPHMIMALAEGTSSERAKARQALINRVSVDFNGMEQIFKDFENGERHAKDIMFFTLNSIGKIQNKSVTEEILEKHEGRLPFAPNDRVAPGLGEHVNGAEFDSRFLLTFFSQRHIIPEGARRSDMPLFSEPGEAFLQITSELRTLPNADAQALNALVTQTFQSVSRKFFIEFAQTMNIDARDMTQHDHVMQFHDLVDLKLKQIFWAIYKQEPLSADQRKFLDLLYKMQDMATLGRAKVRDIMNSFKALSLTEESFLKGLKKKYDLFISNEINPRTIENDIKNKRRMLNERMTNLSRRISKLRCEMLF